MSEVDDNDFEEVDPRIARYHRLDWSHRRYWESDPDRAIAMLEEAIDLAEALNEPFWAMESKHWLSQVILYQKRDYARAMPMVIDAAIEARKPMFQSWRTRICLYQDLIIAYTGADAVSHAEAIDTALGSMLDEAPAHSQCLRCLLGEKAIFDLRRNDAGSARLVARTYLSKSSSNYHKSTAHYLLANIAYQFADWDELLSHAHLAADVGQKPHAREGVALGALLWQAVGFIKLGELEIAQAKFAKSEALRETAQMLPDSFYWDAKTAYYKELGDIDQAIATRRSQLSLIDGLGADRESAEAWLDICRFKQVQGLFTIEGEDEDIEQTKLAIANCQVHTDLIQELNSILGREIKI